MKRCSSSLLDSKIMYDIPRELPCGIKNLPNEVLEHIFSYFEWTSIQSSHLVNRNWIQRTISSVHQERQKTINFLKILEGNLPEEHARVKNLLDFAVVELSFQEKIKEIQVALDGTKERVLNILKDIKRVNLGSLKELSKTESNPKGYANLFKLASLYRDLDKSSQIANHLQKVTLRGQISIELAECGHFDKSLEVAVLTGDLSESDALQGFDTSMIEQGFIPKLILAAGKLRPYSKSISLLRISQILLNRGDLKGALDVIRDAPYKSTSLDQINQLFMLFMRQEDFDKALAVADLLDEVDEVVDW